jgi:hypothetical protein
VSGDVEEALEDQAHGGALRRTRRGHDSVNKHDPLEAAPPELAGRKASEPAIVRWVARNIDDPNPDPAGCPDPFAWTLLRQCREVPGFTSFFVEKLWAKLLRDTEDAGAQKVIDGKPTIDLIEKIQALRGEAELGARPVASPAKQSAFESFDPAAEEGDHGES